MAEPTAADVAAALDAEAEPGYAEHSQRFFKTGPGEYGEGDRFIGVRVPAQRDVARRFATLDLHEIEVLLGSDIHEHRLTAAILLTLQYPKADAKGQRAIYDLTMRRLDRFDNWDIVDTVAPRVVGAHLRDRPAPREALHRLARSPDLWAQRMAMVATQAFIREGDFADTLALATDLLVHDHDLMHKATGWMLREVGKKDEPTLLRFLDAHAADMPRTMLRYAIERLPEPARRHYLAAGR
ncbi:MAG: DNA alkylation repair protein [Acidimicrobiia bacterium]|nr:DNA alkylation repair protein [Acidimicrobiia bacterium]